MNKRSKIIATAVCGAIFLPIFGLLTYSWYSDYQESLNSFTLADVCKLKKGMNIMAAWKILGRPTEYQNYNFSNVYSAQYRNMNRGFFGEIIYTTGKGTITDIYWGQGRTKTLSESGACSNIIS